MNKKVTEKGQALILIAFGIIALVGFTALAVDGGRVFSDRRNAQNAADTAVLAAALTQIRDDYGIVSPCGDYEQCGLDRAADNNYTNNPPKSTVTVEFCDDAAAAGDPCTGLAGSPAEYIRVTITSQVRMTFARVLGREFVTNRVEAIARVQGTAADNPFSAGAGLYSARSDNSDDCMKVNGSANLTLHDTGIFINCTGSSALFLNGSADIGMDANAEVAGCANNPSFPITGTGQVDCGVAQQTVNKDTFKDVPTTEAPPTCSGNAQISSGTISPNASGTGFIPSNITAETTFQPGIYCFINGAGIKTTGGKSVYGNGTVKLVMSAGSNIDLKGANNNFDDLEIYANNSDFDLYGLLTADRFRFFGVGNSNFATHAGAVFTSDNTYIYSETGTIDFDAQSSANMHAPLPGDKFGGLLIYMPWDNPNDFELNGGTNDVWYGTVLIPHGNVTYNGGAGFELHGQVIAYEFTINGGGSSDIYFDSTVTYSQPNDPTMEFTK